MEDNNALAEFGGTIFYDTNYCRKEYSLPDNLVVIYLKDDEVCWCIDTSKNNNGVVVSFDLFSKKIAKNLFPSFYVY
nr:SMI1/KNR4 family protein [Erwinia tracheiphila]